MVDRSAPATVKGFFAQALRTVELWLDLPDEATLVCEGLEDADVVNGPDSLHLQFKEYEGKVSAKEHRDVVAAFLEGFCDAHAAGRTARFGLVSPADARGTDSPSTATGELFRVWKSLDSTAAATRVRELFEKWDPTSEADKKLKAAALGHVDKADAAQSWLAFRDAVSWGYGSETYEEVELRMLERLRIDPRVRHLADAALARLLHRVLVASSTVGAHIGRTLRAADREQILDSLQNLSLAPWTEAFLQALERNAYEKELELGRRTVADALRAHEGARVERAALVGRLGDLVRERKRVVVIGSFGVGKTQLVARAVVAERVAWLDADDLGTTLRSTEGALSPNACVRLDADRGVLVVDGLEAADHAQLAQLTTLLTKVPNAGVVVTVRAQTAILNEEVLRAVTGGVQLDVEKLDAGELQQLCQQTGTSEPSEAARSLIQVPYFFWLSKAIGGAQSGSERRMLEALWTGRNLTGTERTLLDALAQELLTKQARMCPAPPAHEAARDSLVQKGILAADPRNVRRVRFAHDVLLDYAIAHHVLQTKAAAGELVGWLRDIDPVQRSWCLPSIAFEAERQLEQDTDTYWSTACELAERPIIVDWLRPVARTGASLEPLEAMLRDGVPSAFTVMQRLLAPGAA